MSLEELIAAAAVSLRAADADVALYNEYLAALNAHGSNTVMAFLNRQHDAAAALSTNWQAVITALEALGTH